MNNVSLLAKIDLNRRFTEIVRGGRPEGRTMIAPDRDALLQLLKEAFPVERNQNGTIYRIRTTERIEGFMKDGNVEVPIVPLTKEEKFHQDIRYYAKVLKKLFPRKKIYIIRHPPELKVERLGHGIYRQATWYRSELFIQEDVLTLLADEILRDRFKMDFDKVFFMRENEPLLIRIGPLLKEIVRLRAENRGPEFNEHDKDLQRVRAALSRVSSSFAEFDQPTNREKVDESLWGKVPIAATWRPAPEHQFVYQKPHVIQFMPVGGKIILVHDREVVLAPLGQKDILITQHAVQCCVAAGELVTVDGRSLYLMAHQYPLADDKGVYSPSNEVVLTFVKHLYETGKINRARLVFTSLHD